MADMISNPAAAASAYANMAKTASISDGFDRILHHPHPKPLWQYARRISYGRD